MTMATTPSSAPLPAGAGGGTVSTGNEPTAASDAAVEPPMISSGETAPFTEHIPALSPWQSFGLFITLAFTIYAIGHGVSEFSRGDTFGGAVLVIGAIFSAAFTGRGIVSHASVVTVVVPSASPPTPQHEAPPIIEAPPVVIQFGDELREPVIVRPSPDSVTPRRWLIVASLNGCDERAYEMPDIQMEIEAAGPTGWYFGPFTIVRTVLGCHVYAGGPERLRVFNPCSLHVHALHESKTREGARWIEVGGYRLALLCEKPHRVDN